MEIKTNLEKPKTTLKHSDKVSIYKKRMLVWDSPVEYVNNMYGCHPNDKNEEYFKKIFSESD